LSARSRVRWLVAGLFAVTWSTLMLEVLDTRLLSVLTWYHLSFLAVSVAMLGMAAGAVLVFVAGERCSVDRAARLLPGAALALAMAVALSHVANLAIPFPPVRAVTPADIAAIGVATTVLAVPFVISGVVVTLALTRTRAPIGLLYAADLVGAAAGCLAVIALLDRTDITSTAFVTAGGAAVGAWCFGRAVGSQARSAIVAGAVFFAAAGLNAHLPERLGVMYPKNRNVWPLLDTVQFSEWNAHSYVIIRHPEPSHAFLWGPGKNAPDMPVVASWAMIDGEAGTPITKWDGNRASLGWVQYDVTSLPYRLRRGTVGVIGVGGGRDILTAIAAGNQSITGIEINQSFIDALSGPYRLFAGIVDRPGVQLVHDEARSFLTRTPDRFDVLQMSLIDTWAATGAGAFTLTENGLYTREGWQVFLHALSPTGVLSVSRWYAPGAVSETTRLVSLGAASVLDAGLGLPADHLILASAGHVATLMVSRVPFSESDGVEIRQAAARYGFDVLLSPWTTATDTRLDRVAHAGNLAELDAAAYDRDFDFSPPTDARPFFFNMLKPRAVLHPIAAASGGVITGNLVATSALLALVAIVGVLALVVIGWPLAHVGRPALPRGVFPSAVAYFALIGAGFMFVQIPYLQRFSVYLGHPTYTFSIVLFLMILAAGFGSLATERVDVSRHQVLTHALPLVIAGTLVLEAWTLQAVMDRTIGWGLAGRTLIVALFVVPVAAVLGCCFPVGMRLVGRHSNRVTAWMWGVNGACGVVASVVAVMASTWLGIQTNLICAAALYGLLLWPMRTLSGAVLRSTDARIEAAS
jgi:hypothetical protein